MLLRLGAPLIRTVRTETEIFFLVDDRLFDGACIPPYFIQYGWCWYNSGIFYSCPKMNGNSLISSGGYVLCSLC